MRLLILPAVVYLFTTGTIAQSQNQTYIAQEISKISLCGFTCLQHTVPAVGCSIANTTCQCRSHDLFTATSDCMTANCTLVETLELAKIQADICERPNESRNRDIKAMTFTGIIIIYVSVMLRLIARFLLNKGLGLDDWFIIAASLTTGPYAYFGVLIVTHGFGDHVWKFDVTTLKMFLYWFYLCEIFYLLTTTFVKLSIIFFYLHIFPKRSFRIRCWIVASFCVASLFAFMITTIFQCHPITFTWDKTTKGKCVNFNATTWAAAGINIVQDVLIVILPISEVRKLQMNRKKKFGLYIIFGLGGFVCILSAIRMYVLKDWGVTADATWDNQPTMFWSVMESAAAYIGACLPAIRAGFVRIFPKPWGSTTLRSTANSKKMMPSSSGQPPSNSQPWASRALTSNASTLVAADDIAASECAFPLVPMGGIKVERSVRVVVSQLNLMKPLPRVRPHSFQLLGEPDTTAEH